MSDLRVIRTEDFLPSQVNYLKKHGVTTKSLKEKFLVKLLRERSSDIFKSDKEKDEFFRLTNASISSDSGFLILSKLLMPAVSLKIVDNINNIRQLITMAKKLDPNSSELTKVINKINENFEDFTNITMKIFVADIVQNENGEQDIEIMCSTNNENRVRSISHEIIADMMLYKYTDKEGNVQLDDIETAVHKEVLSVEEYNNRLQNALRRYDGMILKSSGKDIGPESKYFPRLVCFVMNTECRISKFRDDDDPELDATFNDIFIVGMEPDEIEMKSKINYLFI